MVTKKITKPLAVFDIDGTIFRSSLLIQLTLALVHNNIFPESARRQIELKERLWGDRKGSYDEYITEVIEVFMKFLKGKKATDIQRVSKKVIAEQKDRVYVYTRDLLKKLRTTHCLVAISGSPASMVSLFKEPWNFDFAFGMQYEMKKGLYTGIISENPVKDKKAFLLRFIKDHSFSLQGSVGVGDTESDAPFLSCVQHPIAFNPNQKLLRYAQRKGWTIIVERKDVVYHI